MSETRPRRVQAQDWLMLVLLSLLWGGSFFFAKIAVAALPPLAVVLMRVAIAAACLWSLVLALRLSVPRDIAAWRDFLVMGLINNAIPFSLIFWGQKAIASGLAAILNATTPIFVIALTRIFHPKESIGPGKWLGVALGLAGVSVMIGIDYLDSLGGHLPAELAVLGAALSYGFAGLYGKRFATRPPLVVAAGQLAGSTLLMSPLLLIAGELPSLGVVSAKALAAIAALALISTALAYVIFFRLMGRIGGVNVSLVTFLIPVSALGLGAIFLGESLALHHIAGMALIALGLGAIDGRPLTVMRRWLTVAR